MHGERAYYSTIEEDRMLSAEEMDRERKRNRVYEYLCHLQEAREWLEKEVGDKIPPDSFEEDLRTGVFLAKLARIFAPEVVPAIFDEPVLKYKHTDNISAFFRFAAKIGLPRILLFEPVDLYEKKNIPRVIYCIHALAHFLGKKQITGKLRSVVGTAKFSDAEIKEKEKEIEESGINLPSFKNISHQISQISIPAPPAPESASADKNKSPGKDDRWINCHKDGSETAGPLSATEFPANLSGKHAAARSAVQTFMRTLLMLRVLSELRGEKPITLFSIRSTVHLLTGREENDEADIEEMNRILSELFRDNATKEKEVSSMENRIALLINNKLGAKNKTVLDKASYMQYRALQKVFSSIHDDPSILSSAILGMRAREAEGFVLRKMPALFGNMKTPKEEYAYLRVVEALARAERLVGRNTPDYLAARAVRALLLRHGSLDIQHRIQSHILEELGKEKGGESEGKAGADAKSVVRIMEQNLNSIPYAVRFYMKMLHAEEFQKDLSDYFSRGAHTPYALFWDVFIFPFLRVPDTLLGCRESSGSIDREAYNRALQRIHGEMLGPLQLPREQVEEYKRRLFDVGSLFEHFRDVCIDETGRSMSSLLCLTGEDVNNVLSAIRAAKKGVSEETKELVEKCLPLPFKLVFVVPGGIAPSSPDCEGVFEKRVAKWAIVRLAICEGGKSIMELLQRRSSQVEEVAFQEAYGIDIEKYKDETKMLLHKLHGLGIIKSLQSADELLASIGREILHRKRNIVTKLREMQATEKAIGCLEAARADIEARKKVCAEYLVLLSAKIIRNSVSYVRPAKVLLEEGIICSMYNWLPSQLESISLSFFGSKNGGIKVDVLVLDMVSNTDSFTLDDLLLRESRGEEEMELEEIGCVFSIPKTLSLINRRFLI